MSIPSRALRIGQPDATRQKYLADHVLRGSLIANETNDEPKHPHVVARIQHLHCKPIAVRDSSDQHLVWGRLHFGLVTLVASDYRGVHASWAAVSSLGISVRARARRDRPSFRSFLRRHPLIENNSFISSRTD